MILVTGAAGFIGYHVTQRLLADGHLVHGLDNLNTYYDPALKRARLEKLQVHPAFTFHATDLTDTAGMTGLFDRHRPDTVIHLAAQAGVRYSLENPRAYTDSNIVGFLNVLEGCRHHGVKHLLFASSSSVYGLNRAMPYSVHHHVDHPISLYAATKKANELMAHSYSHLYRLPVTGLRFFTVYGPWGRPDMAPFLFTKAILEGTAIDIFNEGRMQRDFTYIDDAVEAVVRIAAQPARPAADWPPPQPNPAFSSAPYRLYNIGNHTPVELLHFISLIEARAGRKAVRNLRPMQPGDVLATYADTRDLERDFGFSPGTPIETGVERFVDWYRDYYRI